MTINEATEIFRDNVSDVFGVDDERFVCWMTDAYARGAKWMFLKLTEWLRDNEEAITWGNDWGHGFEPDMFDKLRELFIEGE